SLKETNAEFLEAAWNAATAGGSAPLDLAAGGFFTIEDLRGSVRERGGVWWSFSPFDSGLGAIEAELAEAQDEVLPASGAAARVAADAIPSFQGNVEGATEHVERLVSDGWAGVLAGAGTGLVDRARDVLSERGTAARIVEGLEEAPEQGVVSLVRAEIETGFASAEAKLAVLTESEFYGRSVGGRPQGPKKLASRRRNVVDPLQLKPGDPVVHATHGIGRFVEMVQREVSTGGRNAQKSTRDYVVLEYAPSKRGYPGD